MAWRTMEAIHDSGRARWLGISNVTFEQLQGLCDEARVRPRFVQNRCYANLGWDRQVREFCAANEIITGIFPADRQSRRARPSGTGANRSAPRSDHEPDRLPVRPRRRHDAADRDRRPQPHAVRPRHLRFLPGAGRS